MNSKIVIVILFCINIISCSWVSDTWDKRPDWVMPEDEEEKIELVQQQLFSGFDSSISSGKLEKKLDNKKIEYAESRDSKKDFGEPSFKEQKICPLEWHKIFPTLSV